MQIAKIVEQQQLQYYQNPGTESGGICIYQNPYYRWLTFDSVIQSVMNRAKPSYLVFRHQYKMLFPLAFLKPKSVLELGLGGGSLQRCLHELLPCANVVSIEESALVIELFSRFFNPLKTHYHVHHGDAFSYAEQSDNSQVDWLVYDLYRQPDQSITSIALKLYMLSCKLNEKGWFTLNVPFASATEIRHLVETLTCLFGRAVFIAPVTGFQNVIIHATKQAVNSLSPCPQSALESYCARRRQAICQDFLYADQFLKARY